MLVGYGLVFKQPKLELHLSSPVDPMLAVYHESVNLLVDSFWLHLELRVIPSELNRRETVSVTDYTE